MQYYYAVARGRRVGIFRSHTIVLNSVDNYSNALYKKCKSIASAKAFLSLHNTPTRHEPTECIYIYIDGSCLNNGNGNGNGKDNNTSVASYAGIGVYFGEKDNRNMSRPIGDTDNSIAELRAFEVALNYTQKSKRQRRLHYTIVTDSQYVIDYMTRLGKHFHTHDWTRNIREKSFVRKVYYAFQNTTNVQLQKVKAHTTATDKHSIGNRCADKLAREGAKQAQRQATSTTGTTCTTALSSR